MPRTLPESPVGNRLFSPSGVPRAKHATMRLHTVIPVIHTPYDYYERI
jgi:hypothetical protein